MPYCCEKRLKTFAADLRSEPSGSRFRWSFVWSPLLAAVLITAIVRVSNFDLEAQQAIYQAGQGSWVFGKHPFWKILYDLGTLPAAVIVGAALVGFILSWSRDRFRQWRSVFLYIVLTAVVGPGLIANALLKEYWGRPRPREVEGLGGHHEFEPIFTINLDSFGKSFPCGHATMGFFLFCGFFLLRRHRPKAAVFILIFSLVLGILMGIARMVQGAHFFSDLIWAGVICWFTALGLYYWLGLDRSLLRTPAESQSFPLWARIGGAAAGVAMIAGVALATPYRDVRNFFPVAPFVKEGEIHLSLKFAAGEIEINPGQDFHIEGEAYGHGLPTSNIAEKYMEIERDDAPPMVVYAERISGYLTEANQHLKVSVPWGRVPVLRLEAFDSMVWLSLPDGNDASRIFLAGGDGKVFLHPGNRRLKVSGENAQTVSGQEVASENSGRPVHLIVGKEFEGTVEVLPRQ